MQKEEIFKMVIFIGSAPSYLGMILEGDYNAIKKVKKLTKEGWNKERYSSEPNLEYPFVIVHKPLHF